MRLAHFRMIVAAVVVWETDTPCRAPTPVTTHQQHPPSLSSQCSQFFSPPSSILIIGAGNLDLSTALALARRDAFLLEAALPTRNFALGSDDEGKGKISDVLSLHGDVVAREYRVLSFHFISRSAWPLFLGPPTPAQQLPYTLQNNLLEVKDD